MAGTCEYQTLIENGICQITYCADCGYVRLCLGAMTLHLTGEQFEQLADGLGKAASCKRTIDDPKRRRVMRPTEAVH